MSEIATPVDSLPKGARNIFGFSFFNAVAFQITLGAPIVLYAKTLGATATVLGLMASLTPFLSIMQIPAAYFLQRVGYRKMILMGWGLRNLFTFLIALVPLAGFLDPTAKIAVILVCLFGFNLMRGFASGAWLPWISDLIPESIRGRFLSRDQQFLNLGCLIALAGSAVGLHGDARPWQFTLILLVSFSCGAVSLQFLRRIPEVGTHETMRRSSQPVPWKEMLTYRPFLKLVIFNLLFMLTAGSLGVFTVDFLRSSMKTSESAILALNSLSFLAALISLPTFGRLVDQFGSKAIMRLTLVLLGSVILIWWAQAAHLIATSPWLIGLLYALTGTAGANFNLANVRLTMATMPPMGRNHFFALFTVITSLGLGASPVIWGVVLDALAAFEHRWLHLVWDEYALYFSMLALLACATWVYATRLEEKAPRAEGSLLDAIIGGNLRRLGRLLQR